MPKLLRKIGRLFVDDIWLALGVFIAVQVAGIFVRVHLQFFAMLSLIGLVGAALLWRAKSDA
ncbi:MAG: hypothetical protein OWS74_05160 [Firmicutes bacterium]|nr:hypothetical protein [Bacillota bacterium]